jgi:hypothetical protein
MIMRVHFDQVPSERERLAWCEWFRRHGVNPDQVCVCPGWVERRVGAYQVAYLAYALNERGERYSNPEHTDAVREVRVVQLEGLPLPYPKFPLTS